MESTRHFLPFKFIDKQNESFDPIAWANVFTDADNSLLSNWNYLHIKKGSTKN